VQDKKKHCLYFSLLSAPIFLSLFFYRGHNSKFPVYFPSLANHEFVSLFGVIYQYAFFFALCFLVPLSFIKFYLRRDLKEFGFSLGDWKFGLKILAVVIPLVILPLAYFGAKTPDVQSEYPLAKILFNHHELILWCELAYIFLYYVAWEFYFRGFLLWSVQENFGNWPAILIQTIPSCLIHLGKPESETLGSILAGVLWGMVAIRTRSIWYVFAMHATLGVLTDLFVIWGR
jgi:membrane protease YdiL (CAAX protease family)